MTSFHIAESETAFQNRLTQLAESLDWEWMHIGRTGKYVANGAKGTLGKGWPDLFLVRGDRTLFVECKAADGVLSKEQRKVLFSLRAAGHQVRIWRPSDWPLILKELTDG